MKRKVNLSEITFKEPMKVKTKINSSLLHLPQEEVSKASDFELEVEIIKKPVGYGVKGRISGEVELTCSRCNEKFRYEVNKSFDYKLLPTSEITGGEIKSAELDVKFSDSEVLDLAEVVEEQILLNLPVKPLCSENCSVEYFEEGKEVDKRWSKLEALKDKLKKEKRDGSSKEESFKNEKG